VSAPQHLLEYTPKLLIRKLLRIALRLSLPAEPKRAPRKAGEIEPALPLRPSIRTASLLARPRHLLIRPLLLAGPTTTRPRPRPKAETEIRARVVVLAPSTGVGQGVVGVVDLLELAGAGGALGAVGGDAVWVVFQGGFFVGVADLLLGCGWGDVEGRVVVYRWC